MSDRATNRVLRYDAFDGSFLGALVDDNLETNGGLFVPAAMTYGFDHDLYVTSIDLETGDGRVLRYDADSGDFKGVFASGLVGPSGLFYHQTSGTMLVGSMGAGLGDSNVITRLSSTGDKVGTIEIGPISGRTDMSAADDGTLYVSSFVEEPFFSGSVLRYNYDSQTDTFSDGGVFATAPLLTGANGNQFDDQGDLWVASLFGQSVIKFDVENGSVVGSSVFANTAYPSDVFVAGDGTVLISSLGNNNPNDPIYQGLLFPGFISKYDPTGALIDPAPFMTGGEEFQPTSILWRESASVPGDYDGDGELTAADIDELSLAVRQGSQDTQFDLNADGQIDNADRQYWVNELKRTFDGDSNLDGEFNTGDLVLVFAAGEYEDELDSNSGWSTGDWSGDTEFDTTDLVVAFQAGGFEQGPRAAVASVPEPATISGLVLAAGVGLAVCRRRVGRVSNRRAAQA